VHIIVRGMRNLPINFGVSRTFRSRLIGQQLSDVSRDLATLTFDLGGHGARMSVIRVFALRLCTKLEVLRPFRSEDITHFKFQHSSTW